MPTSSASLPTLKLLEKGEIWNTIDQDAEKYCLVIFTDGQTTFRARTSYTLAEVESHLDELDPIPFAADLFRPKVQGEPYVKVTTPLPDNCYIKTPRLLMWSEEHTDKIHALVLSEARTCEVLMKNPHPNVAKYFGCRQDGPYITGLCFEKHPEDLHDRVINKGVEGLSVDAILQGIRHGIEHIHGLGYCHNDICPGNIMLRSDGTPVIIDFDSCQPTGAKIGFKAGTPFFSEASCEFSKPGNDFYGLKKIEEGLRRGGFDCI